TSTTTDAAGGYSFTGLPAGDYQVDTVGPAGWLLTAGVDPRPVTLTAGQAETTADFGYQQAQGFIGDLVYDDVNGNGAQDGGENGLPGLTVRLLDGNGALLSTTTTDGSGAYSFAGLAAGDYQVDVTAPQGWVVTAGPFSFTLASGESR